MIKKILILLILNILPLTASHMPIVEKGRFKPIKALETGTTTEQSIWNEQLKSRIPLQIDGILSQKLMAAGGPLTALPSKVGKGRWLPLNSLMADVFDASINDWRPADNFTLYSDTLFVQIRDEYRTKQPNINRLETLLLEGYATLAGRTYLPNLQYPSLLQLKAEAFYFSWPLIPFTIILYFIAIVCLLKFPRVGIAFTFLAFLIHTAVLLLRVYILDRPPVSNMFETVIYVPWIAVVTGILFSFLRRDVFPLFPAIGTSIILLLVLKISKLDSSMENVQAVLNSQFWLSIHVLMVVGSYGVLIFSGLLGHIYLLFRPKTTIAKTIIQSMYLGTGLLIMGTLLGGVWAAQSWGRFWDWDPKESWAFISSCFYLTVIHAYRFRKIADFGLAVGSVLGLLAIGFTWYGVNYILGTGLHSYGFGHGGEIWFYGFAFLEFFVVGLAIKKARRPKACEPTPHETDEIIYATADQ